MVTIICVLNHERISWVSIEIYYHDNFVFGHIFMFLTSIFAHFCVLCTYLVGKQQEAYGESNHGMLFICWHMLFFALCVPALCPGHWGWHMLWS